MPPGVSHDRGKEEVGVCCWGVVSSYQRKCERRQKSGILGAIVRHCLRDGRSTRRKQDGHSWILGSERCELNGEELHSLCDFEHFTTSNS